MDAPKQPDPDGKEHPVLDLPSTDFEPPTTQTMPLDRLHLTVNLETYATALEMYPNSAGKYAAKVLREFLAKDVDRGDTFVLGDTADDRKVGYLLSMVDDARKTNQHFADLIYHVHKKDPVDPEDSPTLDPLVSTKTDYDAIRHQATPKSHESHPQPMPSQQALQVLLDQARTELPSMGDLTMELLVDLFDGFINEE